MSLQDRLQTALGSAYTIERELGGGGMSRVFVALETDLGRKVVVKVLPPEMGAGVNSDRFRREIQLAASLQHPHIVPLLHAGRADDLVWYTMPLIEGESLRAKVAREGELPIAETVKILRDVADALAHAHSHGVVHRDIKPDNVLISGHHALVTDFGVAKALSEATGESSITSIGVALGTPAYMAPEQAAADPHVDHRADLYALGALAYEMLTGRPPFVGTNPQQVLAAQVTQSPEPVTQHRAAVPPGLAALVMRCLEKKPADRWQHATEVHSQLETMATPSGGTAPTTATRAVARPVSKKAVIPVAVLIVALGAFVALRGTGGPKATIDANVVAVMPFRIAGADPALHYLREGMIDLLAAKLTGEGGPRAADPRTVTSAFRRAAGNEAKDLSQDEAVEVARAIGAGQALLGGIVGSPAHVTLSASVVSVPGGATRAQASVEGSADSLPILIDRLAAQLLIREAALGSQGEAGITTRSLPAIQAYLAGQRAYRAGAYDSAATQLGRALRLDSTFTLAAYALVVTNGWGVGVPDIGRVRDAAWAGRDRLSIRDRLLLEAYLGPRYPEPPTEAELLAARERAVSAVPDQADAWYFLGDKYFHSGRFMGYADWMERSQAAFERAVQLDSSFAGPLSHLINIAAEAHDSAAALRYTPLYMANVAARGGRFDILVRWDAARALHDEATMREVWQDFERMANRPWYAPVLAQAMGEVASTDTFLAIMGRRASSQDDRIGRLRVRWVVELNRGHPAVAHALTDTIRMLDDHPGNWADEITDALYADGDSARGAAAERHLAALADQALADSGPRRSMQLLAMCVAEQWRIAHGRFTTLERTFARLRSVTPARDSRGEVRNAVGCALHLEVLAATAQRRPEALRLVQRSDSIMRQGVNAPSFVNLALGRMFEALGEPAQGLAAVRRGGWFSIEGELAAYARMEGRLAAATGDRAGAIRAYQRYLDMRPNPEPSVKPEVDEVKAELARLVRETN